MTPPNDDARAQALFSALVFSLHAAGMQQLGKIMNPMSGKVERDLEQAQATIEMMEMLKRKTAGNLDDYEGKLLSRLLAELQMNYVINEGDGAFYGPKIDFHLEDSIGRTWQCGTIQLDFQLPLRFEAEYIGADGEKHRPIMIHRVVFGSIERFIGILIEHYAGKFPVWLAPVQIKILPISEKFSAYSKDVLMKFKEKGIRCEMDERDEKIGYKIREAQLEKVPYMIILGEKEAQSGMFSVRSREQGDIGILSFEKVIEHIELEK